MVRLAPPAGERADERRYRAEEKAIGSAVAALGGGEQFAPAVLSRNALIVLQTALRRECNLKLLFTETVLNDFEEARPMECNVTKRTFIGSAAAAFGSLVLGACTKKGEAAPAETFEVTKTAEEWRAILTPEQYAVLRAENTERAGSSPLNKENRRGTYVCAGCAPAGLCLEAKFESGTGWPSFTAPIANAVRTKEDRGFLAVRTEVHCRRCGGHLGHVFDDGPPPTGMRYCMNGVAMNFVAA
jgi:peptide-methionine (R)-S-oxide reductase